jgi:Sulfotransferase domain
VRVVNDFLQIGVYVKAVTTPLRLPNFIGVGPPRTATTWLHDVLSSHVGLPQGVKETDFFVWQYEKGLKWYAAHFRGCPPDKPMGEFSPNYFIGAQTRERIAKDIPGCKIICTLRDPVERTYSHYRKMREGGYFSGSFEECLEKRSDILEWGRYAFHVKAWRNYFGIENVLILLQDDLKANPQGFLDRACDFIGISRISVAESPSRDRLANAISNLPRYQRIARVTRILRDRFQRSGNYGIVNLLKKTGLRNFLFSGGPAFEPLTLEIDSRLRKYFRSEIEDLEAILGRDLSGWKDSKRNLGQPRS